MALRLEEITQPTEQDITEAAQASEKLNRLLEYGEIERMELRTTVNSRTIHAIVPAGAFQLLLEILGQMANGNAVTVIPVHAELTTQKAAELLNVSRPFVVKLIDEKKLPATLVGTHRRIRMEDLVTYKERDDAERDEVLRQLTQEAQNLGLDYGSE